MTISSRLTYDQKTKLDAYFEKAVSEALRHDVKYLAEMKTDRLEALRCSADSTARTLGEFAAVIKPFLAECHSEQYHAPWPVVAACTAALLYLVNPFDLVPDTLPEGGYEDDLYMLSLALKTAGDTLHTYAAARGLPYPELM